MKHLLSLIFIAITAIVSGQTANSYNQDSVVYLTNTQEAFMIDKETKYLIKTGPLAFERKLNPSFSLDMVFQPSYSGRNGIKLKTGLELRHYYKLAKLIKEGKQANNLSSEYIAAGVGYDGGVGGSFSIGNTYSYNIIWGSQKRFLNYGYFDSGLKLSYENFNFDLSLFGREKYSSSFVSLSVRTKVGFAFGKKYKIEDDVKCPIFKCYIDRKSAFKFNINQAFNLSYGTSSLIGNNNVLNLKLNPNISYEFKLGSSPFTINQELRLLATFSSRINNFRQDAGISEYSLGYTAGIRHYFKQKSNVSKGKSGNNLSGIYWSASASYEYGDSKLLLYDRSIDVEVGKHKYIDIPVGIGYQQSVLNDYYFDFQLGMNFRAKEYIRPNDAQSHEPNAFLEFKVGKLF